MAVNGSPWARRLAKLAGNPFVAHDLAVPSGWKVTENPILIAG